MSGTGELVIAAATRLEARPLRRALPGASVRVVGMGVPRPLPAGCTVLSAGVCGGLDPSLRPGDVVVPAAVAGADGVRHAVDPDLHALLCAAAERAGPRVHRGDLVTTPAPVTGAARASWAARGFVAADMESAILLATAARGAVLRIVLDTAAAELPVGVTSVAAVLTHPRSWPAAWRLGALARRYAADAAELVAAAVG